MANWAELMPDLLWMIAKKVDVYEDYVAFRGVCRSWRSLPAKKNFCHVQPQPQVPWLLLAGDEEDNRDLYSLTKGGMVHTVDLPEAKGKRILSSLGWLITIDEDGEMELLHPLSRSRICLPRSFEGTYLLDTEPIMIQDRAISMLNRAALSARPSEDESYTLMTLICDKLAYWRPGNKSWITINISRTPFSEVLFFGGQFYAMDYEGQLYLVDINNKTANIVGRIPLPILETEHCYLVDSGDGHMIAVFRQIELLFNDDGAILDYWTKSFKLFKFDSSYNCHPINDLGEGRSLFIGQCASVLVSVSVGSGSIIRQNCIYFTDDAMVFYFGDFTAGGGGRDMGVYSLEQQEFIKDGVPIYQGNKGRSPLCPPLWIVPSF